MKSRIAAIFFPLLLVLFPLLPGSDLLAQEAAPETRWLESLKNAGPRIPDSINSESIPLYQQLYDSFMSISGGFFFALGLIAGILFLRRATVDVVRRRLNAALVMGYVYLSLFFVTMVARMVHPGMFKFTYFLSLAILSLAGVWLAGVLLIDILLVRARNLRMPTIIRDIVVVLTYVVTLFVVLGNEGIDLTAILASAGFIGLFFGLALQDTLTNLMSGLAMQMEKPFDVGDWVQFGDQEGVVDEINWRSVKLKTFWSDVVVIPNSVITKSAIINFSKPQLQHKRKLNIGLPYGVPPNKVKQVLMDAVDSVPGVAREPRPRVVLRAYEDFYVRYKILFYVDRFRDRYYVEDEVMTRIWYALKRAGITIPFPITDVFVHPEKEGEEVEVQEKENREVRNILERVTFFRPLSSENMDYLAAAAKREFCPAGVVVVRQGDPGHSFYVLFDGEVSVSVKSGESQSAEVARLGRGEYFGEMSLMTGERRSATVRTERDTEFLVIDKDIFRKIVEGTPEVLGRISELIVSRKVQMSTQSRDAASDHGTREDSGEARTNLVSRILQFFKID